ncbi:hemagglutinin repeat-containing protein [Xanthomonas oryzae]|uniref:hemagglutinin repeat-containing protein n=1 Tax=Xanthomonas oryzae TaxID=347 RepID=UPI0006556D50|nr:hemagglutinin repeat-containing protein [Xanthomonas oryzae]AKO21211.1 membrane protein [Xanthomonas oryzae pv. oryzicola]WVN06964.1 hemagglutinin repeat-containing protein [Xanthomonas oryzae pv. oryzicola]
MNRIYRLVFNRTLRVWQVASELVRVPGGRMAGAGATVGHPVGAPLTVALLAALGLGGWSGALLAQSTGRIVGDAAAPGNERPTVLTAPNGVPLVNITTPSAAGVSRNRYSQFDVGREGAIVNNARGQTQTQLGGWVQGNPWLATGGARVILNEINGPASRLNGYVEVAGQRAEVIIANPAGIQVDGGGFLNASRVTLTTGTPILSGGALEGYRVSGGAIQIGGAGLDTSRADYTDLITRSLQVNAGIWANQLQATLGNNVVSADHRSVATQAADGQAPTFALDVGALGGMFANKIWLVGNEHGVGVRNAGNLGAQAGELVVTVDGRLENTGALQSQQDTQIAASGGIANSGTLSAARELRVGTAADLDNRGGTLDAQRLQIDAASLRNQGGTLTQTGMQALEVTAGSASNRTGGSIGALATAPSRDGGSPAPGGDNTGTDTNNNAGTGTDGGRSPTPTPGGQSPVATAPLATGTLHIAGLLDNDGGRIGNGGAVRLAAAAGLDNSAGQLGVAALQVRGDLRNSAGTLEVQGDADLHLGALVNDQGRFSVANALNLQAQSLSNRAGDLRHGGSAASTWQVAGLLDNQGGVLTSNAAALQLQAQTVVNADGRIVHTGTQGLTLAAQTWSGAGGSIVTPGALTWQAGSIDHRNATLTTSQLVVQAATLDNRGGTLVSSGTQAASVHVDAALDNGAGGTIASNGALDLRAATLGNAGGQIQQAGPGLLQIAAQAIDGNGGRLLSNGGLTLTGGRIDLTGGTTAAQQVQIQAETLTTAGGSVSSLGDQALQLTVRQGLDNHAGHLASNAGLAIAAGALSNQGGAIAAAGTTDATVTVAGRLDNSGGSISGNGRVAVDADTLINQHGSVLAANGAPLQLHAASLLDNSAGGRLASGGEFAVQAGTLDNRGGAIEHSGNGTLAVSADTLQGAGGSLLSLGSLQLRGGVLDLGTGSTTQADRIDIAAASLRTAGGHLSATGSGPLQVHLSDTLDNRGGSIASNGALDLQAATLLNSDGTLSGAGSADGRITVSGQLDNTRGRIAANGATLQIAADQLINAQGTLSHAGSAGLVIDSHRLDGSQGNILTSGMLSLTAATVDHRGATIGADRIALDVQQLDNSGGRIVASGTGASSLQADTLDNASGIVASAGDLTVGSTLLDNTQGTLQHSGNGQLHLTAQTLLGYAGKLLSNGALTLHGQTTDLRNATTSAAALSIDTGDLTTAGGTLVATGSQLLTLTARGTLDNSGGNIGGNGVLALSAQTLRNAQGTLQVAGTGASTVDVAQALQNQQGKLLLGGSGRIAAASIDNQGGTLYAAGTALQVQVAGLLDNHAAGTVSSAGQLSVGSGSLDNSAGTLVAGTDLNVTTTAAIGNDAGALQAGGGVQLQSAGLSNRAGSVIGGQVVVDTGGQTLDNSAGTIGSKLGTLQIRSGTLANAGGRLQSQTDLTLQSNGAAIVNSNSGSTGGILAGAALQIDGGTLDNRNGAIVAQGQARLGLASVDNSSAGVLSAAGNFTLTAATLDNTSGRVQGGQNLTLQLSGALANQAGLVTTRNLLTLNAATVDNRNTRANALQGLQALQLQVQAQALDNRQGQVISDGAGTVQLSAALDNSGGQISSGSSLDMRADAVTNTAGLLRSGGNQRLDARALSGDGQLQSQGDLSLTLREGLTNTGELSANGTLSIHTDGDLANQGVLRAGNLEVAARNIDNAANGQITSQGLTHLVSNGQLVNRGLIDGGLTHLQAATLDNLGTGRIYGDHVAIAADNLRNRAETISGVTRVATVAARNRLDLGVGQLSNTDRGLIYSDGDAAIGGTLDGNRLATGIARQIDNLGSTIEVAGDLDLHATTINNIRQNVVVTQTTTTLAPVRLDQPSWRNNGANNTSNIRSTTNYSAFEIYYLNPQDILEDTPYITPDGYQVRRAVIRVTPQTSAYLFGRGSLYGATGERSRMDPSSGTLTIYYTGRQDNQANPDQVTSGADDPFRELSQTEPGSPAFHYASDTLRYSNAYGTCTTNCVQLWAQFAYTDPDHILLNPQGTGGGRLGDQEHYRTATRTIVEDVLQPGAGPEAVIHAGGALRIGTDALHNTYARIAAGGDLGISGLTHDADVTNLAYTLYRTHSFNNVTTAYNGTTRSWSNPSISEQIGQVGGALTSGGTLTIDVGNLSNLNQGRDAPNVQAGAVMANLNIRGAQAAPTGPGRGSVGGAANVSVDAAGRIIATVTQAANGNVGGAVNNVANNGPVNGPRVVNAAGGSPDRIAMGTPDTRAPTGSLFTLRPASGHYLVETDPQFTDYRSWLGSDYLLSQMGYSADTLQKRLGDGYYEQKLVREQIGQLTGRRFLDGYKDDEAQYQALLDAGATIGKAWNLRPGIALSEAQMAQLTSDIVWLVEQTVTLPDGSTTTALVPQVYLRLRPGDLDAGGALLAGANVDVSLAGGLKNTGTIAGRQLVSIDAGRIAHLGGSISGNQVALRSASDIRIEGASVTAVDALSVQAVGDVTVASTVETLSGGGYHQYSTTQLQRVAGLYVTGATGSGVLSVVGGGDVTLQAAQIHNAGTDGVTQLVAGNNLTLGAQTLTHSTDTTANDRNFQRSSQTTHLGTTVQGAGNLVLAAGNDLTLTAAQVGAGKGLALQAGRDINSVAAVDSSSSDRSSVTRSHSLAASSTDETVRGTQLGAGSNIVMQAGHDLTLAATAVASQSGGIALAAGHDIQLLATQEQHDAVVDQQTRKKSALSSKTVTTHDESHDSLAVTTSLSGDTVHIAAGNDLRSQGAQIVGTGDVVLAAGNNLTLETAQSTHSESHDKQTVKSGLMGSGGIGFTIGKQTVKTEADTTAVTHTGSTVGSLEGNVTLAAGNTLAITGSDVMALQGDITAKAKDIAITEVHDTSDSTQKTAFKQGGLTVSLSSAALNLAQAAVSSAEAGKKAQGDTRMQALAGASAAYSAYGASQAMGSASAKDAAQGAGLKIAVTVGGSKSQSQTTQQSATTKGSTLQAGGNVNLIATGGGEDSNILVRGSDLKAANNLLLSADHDITLEAAQDSFEQHSTSKSSSAAIGVAVTYGADGFAAGVTVSASGARGKADGQDITQRNSHLSAGNTATLISGNDTTLKGAVLSANTVLADIGGDLNIESLQDTSTYTSKDKAVGGSVTFGMGFSASGSYSSNKVNGDFASVKEQSGIQAGDGGFDIRVHGNTDLKGAVIASTQAAVDAGTNRLQTGTLTVSDITNTSNYKATGISLSGGYAAGGSDGKDGAKTDTQTPPTTNNGSNWSWQNQGSGVQGASAGFSSKSGSSTSTTASGISGGTVIMTDQAGQQAKTDQSVSDVLAALNRDVHTGDSANGLVKGWDGQKLQQQVSAGAEITATFGQQASKAIGDYADKKTKEASLLRLQAETTTDPDQRNALLGQAQQLENQWGANGTLRVLAHTAVGGLTGGIQGAMGSAAGTLTAPVVANALKSAGVDGVLADSLTALASTAAGSLLGAGAGSAAAFNEVTNNYLSHQQIVDLKKDLSLCGLTGSCDEVVQKYVSLSKENDQALQQSCATDPLGSTCQEGVREALNYTGDRSWKNYGSYIDPRLGSPLTQMDDDIEVSRKTALDLIFSNRQIYGAINNIDARADFFGAMAYQTDAAWFSAAEAQSRKNLSGFIFGAAVVWNMLWLGGDVMTDWRAAAGNQIMANGHDNFKFIYDSAGKVDAAQWSLNQLGNEQRDPVIQKIHEKYTKNMKMGTVPIMEFMGGVDDLLNPEDRVDAGCRNMGYDAGCAGKGSK